MPTFLEDNWLVLLSLLVALVGGIPGFLAVLDHLRKGPRFGVDVPHYISGSIKIGSGPELTFILLTLTVTNRGERPLTPAKFYLRIKLSGHWVPMDGFLIPTDVTFQSEHQAIELDNAAEHDLQRFNGSVTIDNPLHGHLMFVTDDVTLDTLRGIASMESQLTCVDVFGKKHRESVKLEGRELIKGRMEYPKHGVVVKATSPNDESADA